MLNDRNHDIFYNATPLRHQLQGLSFTSPCPASLSDLLIAKEALSLEMTRRGHERLEILHDANLGISGFVAIHNTKSGPALGGLRITKYNNAVEAGRDTLDLAEGMTLKARAANLPLGGGKGVLMAPAGISDEAEFFKGVGRLLSQLFPDGAYITAEDLGTSVSRLEEVKKNYPFVVGTSKGVADPSPYTALGVFLSIEAVAKEVLGQSSLNGLTVAIQGLGHVGMPLAEKLHAAGAHLIVADIDQTRAKEAVQRFGARISEDIISEKCDILCPCARGAVVNKNTIASIRAKALVGAANNIIASEDEELHKKLHQQNCFVLNDFVANGGGLLAVATELRGTLRDRLEANGWNSISRLTDAHPLDLVRTIPGRFINAHREARQLKEITSLHILNCVRNGASLT